ncbi:hypothetical protein [Salinibacter altiplanensis]|uniref:hypothetical protein n=1 Tax=Salinibacter altiplanensis TaxID=1803181 RepID=UPI000C9F432F|nr:hypothetical protein [Salinibacter altiplanensis]
MQFLYDNLTATVVALMTTLILLSIQSRATQNSVAEVSRNRMGELTQTFSSWLEEDIQRMGENFEEGERTPFESPTGSDITTQFTFYRDSTTASGSDQEYRIATRYKVSPKGTRMVDGTEKTLYELTRKKRRKEMGTGSWSSWSDVKGVSPSSLGYFKISLLDKDANPVANPAANEEQVHSVRVRFSVVSPFQNAQTFPQATHVGSVLLVRDQSDASVINVPKNAASCTPKGWKEMTDPTGTPFGCAAACMYTASGGSQGSNKCPGGKGGP